LEQRVAVAMEQGLRSELKGSSGSIGAVHCGGLGGAHNDGLKGWSRTCG
jgi:hypothetical protein